MDEQINNLQEMCEWLHTTRLILEKKEKFLRQVIKNIYEMKVQDEDTIARLKNELRKRNDYIATSRSVMNI